MRKFERFVNEGHSTMFEALLEKYRQRSINAVKKGGDVQPCFVRFSYIKADEKGNEQLVFGHQFVRDLKDALSKAELSAKSQKGELAKVWISFFTEADPKLDLVYGKGDGDDDSMPISADRVVETMHQHYKEKVKEPKAERTKRSEADRERLALKRSGKPRVRMPAGETMVVVPKASVRPVAPEKPEYRHWQAVAASKFRSVYEESKASAQPDPPFRGDLEEGLPWGSEFAYVD